MKKEKMIFRLLLVTLVLGLTSTFTSCSKDDEKEVIGITVCVLNTSVDSYNTLINGLTGTIENSVDMLPKTTQAATLKACTLTITPTLGATAYYNGEAITANTKFDFSTTRTAIIQVKKGDLIASYTLNVITNENDADLAKGVQMAADISAKGFPATAATWEVAYYNGKFIANVTAPEGDDLTHYNIYSSADGVNWTKETTTPAAVGGLGATPVIFKDKLYIMGGAKIWGTDDDGNEAEQSWGMATISSYRIYEANADATSFDQPVGNTPPYASCFNQFAELNGTLYAYTNKMIGFGMFQGSRMLYKSTDAITYELAVPEGDINPFAGSGSPVFFSFKGKLFVMGGFKNFISESNGILTNVYSSSNGDAWEQVAENTAVGSVFDATVVTTANYAYLFGGQIDVAGTLNDKVYRSADGITWEAIEVNSSYKGVRCPHVVVDANNIAWVVGGDNTKAHGSYGTGADKSKYVPSFSVWAFQLD